MIQALKHVYRTLREEGILLRECLSYWRLLLRYSGSIQPANDKEKLRYLMLRENHIIEKGLSLRNTRVGFGQIKVEALLCKLDTYLTRYPVERDDHLLYLFSTVHRYIEYTHEQGVAIDGIEQHYRTLLQHAGLTESDLWPVQGVVQRTREDVLAVCNASFEALANSRHSLRMFSPEPPARELIVEALSLAQRTPSACNRQAWHTHVYTGQQAHDLLIQQGGCRGFEHEVPYAILVTADLRAFYSYEAFQAYIDGGMYVMNLLNALHSKGLGTIPISCGFYQQKLETLRRNFNVPDNELLIAIVGTGHYPDTFKVADSRRKAVELTNTFH